MKKQTENGISKFWADDSAFDPNVTENIQIYSLTNSVHEWGIG